MNLLGLEVGAWRIGDSPPGPKVQYGLAAQRLGGDRGSSPCMWTCDRCARPISVVRGPSSRSSWTTTGSLGFASGCHVGHLDIVPCTTAWDLFECQRLDSGQGVWGRRLPPGRRPSGRWSVRKDRISPLTSQSLSTSGRRPSWPRNWTGSTRLQKSKSRRRPLFGVWLTSGIRLLNGPCGHREAGFRTRLD